MAKTSKTKFHLVQALLPMDLFRRFRSSHFRKDSTSDGEALRAILKNILKVDMESQEKNATPTSHSITE